MPEYTLSLGAKSIAIWCVSCPTPGSNIDVALSQPDLNGFTKSGCEVSVETVGGVETAGPASWVAPPDAATPKAIATIAIVSTIAALSILTIIDPSLTIC